jgi:hypothetical protein
VVAVRCGGGIDGGGDGRRGCSAFKSKTGAAEDEDWQRALIVVDGRYNYRGLVLAAPPPYRSSVGRVIWSFAAGFTESSKRFAFVPGKGEKRRGHEIYNTDRSVREWPPHCCVDTCLMHRPASRKVEVRVYPSSKTAL